MKIGILTQPLHVNYGGLLQNYALQKVLMDRGHEVLTVDLPFKKGNFFKNLLSALYRKYIKFNPDVRLKTIKPTEEESKVIRFHTDKFIERYLNRTELISDSRNLSRLVKYHFNAYIVGSDQVWRPKYSPNITSFYLDFLKNDSSVKKISYAASFGVDFWEYSPELTSKCKELIQMFDAVSVREDSGVNLCKEHFDIDTKCVLDPTLLLRKEDYVKLIDDSGFDSRVEKSLMMYVLDSSDDKRDIVNHVLGYFNLKENSVMPLEQFSEVTRTRIENCVYPPVTDWLRGFRDAEFVVTDSFHGTVLSIIFNKNFISIGNKDRGLSRFTSLLRIFDLESRLVTKFSDINQNHYVPIDFSKVNSILEKKRNEDLNFLYSSLG